MQLCTISYFFFISRQPRGRKYNKSRPKKCWLAITLYCGTVNTAAFSDASLLEKRVDDCLIACRKSHAQVVVNPSTTSVRGHFALFHGDGKRLDIVGTECPSVSIAERFKWLPFTTCSKRMILWACVFWLYKIIRQGSLSPRLKLFCGMLYNRAKEDC